MAGYGRIAIAMKFVMWVIQQDQFPTVGAVMTHFGCSEATAYRWTAAYAEACGIDPHNRHGGLPL
ncbi:helix-turn-helix domain-containing protein [Pseudoxanthomonas sp. USHLN014]